MEAIDGLLQGFSVAFTVENILYVILGVSLGTVIGLLPGLGPVASIAVLLPVTFHMEPTSAIIMMAGIYYGGMYGGRIPAILLNIPGDASSVVTTLDGYPLAQQGRAGPALGTTAIGSFIGGSVSIIGLTFFAPLVAQMASQAGAPERFVLAFGGILLVSFISSSTTVKALSMAGVGLLLASVGTDSISGDARLSFGVDELRRGIDIVPLAVGLFGIGEILYSAEKGLPGGVKSTKLGRKLPTAKDWAVSKYAILRSSVIGFFIGLVPGGGGALSSLVAYAAQKRLSKQKDRIGKGAMDGLAATETADNASSTSAFIPLLTLGLPPNPVLALMFGVLLIHNVTPGPSLVSENPDIFWGVIASMYIGNVVLLLLNLPLIGVVLQILRVRSSTLFPIVILIAFCGVYSANSSLFDVGLALVFGFAGYFMKKFGFDGTPLILAFVLGPIIESEFRRSLLLSSGSLEIFVGRPGSLVMLLVLATVAVSVAYSRIRRARTRSRGAY